MANRQAAQYELPERLTTLLIGAGERAEFRAARQMLGEMTALLAVPSCEAAQQHITKGGVVPDLLVVAQSRPGEFSIAQVERLRRAAPLARVVGLLGSWCEGEARTGRPWPGATRVYWYHWLPQCARNVGQLLDGVCPSWGLPVTANEEDRTLAAAVHRLPRQRGGLAIATRHRETYAALAGACELAGYHAQWFRPGAPAADFAAGIWVGGDLSDWEARILRQFCTALPDAPVLALLDFPRISTIERAHRLGAASVLARPFQLEDLGWHLNRLSKSEVEERKAGFKRGIA